MLVVAFNGGMNNALYQYVFVTARSTEQTTLFFKNQVLKWH